MPYKERKSQKRIGKHEKETNKLTSKHDEIKHKRSKTDEKPNHNCYDKYDDSKLKDKEGKKSEKYKNSKEDRKRKKHNEHKNKNKKNRYSSGEIEDQKNLINETEPISDNPFSDNNYNESPSNKSYNDHSQSKSEKEESEESNKQLSDEVVNIKINDQVVDHLETVDDDYLNDYLNDYVPSKFESISNADSDRESLRSEGNSQSASQGDQSDGSYGSSISSSRNPHRKSKRAEGKENLVSYNSEEHILQFSPEPEIIEIEEKVDLRPFYYPAIQGCRLVEEFECLNRIEEGAYGVVFRAKDRKTDEIVALKRLKMEKERDGFPITSLREINTLMKARHENVVTVREVVVGSNMDKIYLVMDFIEHDLKSLMQSMVKPFEICEVKCLLIQLLKAVGHLHDNWILHRDLKTSNLLLSHKGVLKVADFGLAREYGSPLKNYTRLVVTLWYRAPELLLGTKTYSTQIDMWSVGCIFGEFIMMAPLFPGKNEAEQVNLLYRELGTPNEKIWPGYSQLPNVKRFNFQNHEYNRMAKKFANSLTETGLNLLNRFLAYCPDRRITASAALEHAYFQESPIPISHEMFPIRPAKSEGGVLPIIKHASSPKPPSGGEILQNMRDDFFIIP